MDMLMIDVSKLNSIKAGDEVVIFNDITSLFTMANRLETIPYEVMTSISDRVHRVYIYE